MEVPKTEATPSTAVSPSPAPDAPAPVSPLQQILNDLAQNVTLLDKAVSSKEMRHISRVLRTTSSIRRRLNPAVFEHAFRIFFPKGHSAPPFLQKFVGQADAMEIDVQSAALSKPPAIKTQSLPELETYFGLLALEFLVDQKKFDLGMSLSLSLVEKGIALNRRSLDPLLAKIFFNYSNCAEAIEKLEDIRSFLLNSLRTATLHHDEDCQGTLLNLLLRNYIHYNLLDQADKLVAKTTFPESSGNNQFARYHYYLGKIKAIQLDYSESHKHLMQALRKAPQAPMAAGFQQAVSKLSVIVQLLLGEIPERSLFRQPVLQKALVPYLHITQAVRVGDLPAFHRAMQEHGAQFQKDKTYTLILRLRHNVIKTGIRMVSLSYSRIPLKDICHKLHLDNEEDAEFIVSKAIRDGVIDASLDHQHKFMKSKDIVDIYSTNEPQESFHQRISFCLNLHNEAVKNLRFPPSAHKKEMETPEERLEREQQEKELARELAEDDDDDMF